MKNIAFGLILIFILGSCSCKNNNIMEITTKRMYSYLTNDSIKFWESYPPIQNHCLGLYFAKNGICDEFSVDNKGLRMFLSYGDVIMDKPFHFKIAHDSLYMYVNNCFSNHCKIHRYKILKLAQDTLVLLDTYQKEFIGFSTNEITHVNYYYPAKDQSTKPKFWHELYPYDKSKWPYGTY